MANKLQKVGGNKWPGVYAYESPSRKHLGKNDICYYYTLKADGRKITQKVGWVSEGYSPPIAAEERAKKIREHRHPGSVKTDREIRKAKQQQDRTLDDLADLYFKQRGGSEQAGKFDRYRYDKHVSPILGKRPVSSISTLDINRIEGKMKGKAAATVWGALELIRRISNWGKKAKLSPGLSFIIKMPTRDNEVIEHLSPEQTKRFLKVLASWKAPDVARMLKVAMFSGMRRGEIFKLQDDDIDLRNKIITLRSPKSGKTCAIPLNPMVEKVLREQIKWRNDTHPGSNFVFPGKKGGKRVDSTAVDRIKAAAKLPKKFRIFHGLRHHYAVTLANSGEFTLDMIGELLSHRDPSMTRRYAQFLPDTKKKAADRAAELLMKTESETRKSSQGQMSLPFTTNSSKTVKTSGDQK